MTCFSAISAPSALILRVTIFNAEDEEIRTERNEKFHESYRSSFIKVCNTAGKPLASSPKVDEWLYAVAFGQDDNVVCAGDWRGRLHRFDVKSKQLTSSTPLAPVQ